MAISKRVQESMKSSSWVRAMFETGIRLKAEHGAENVFDLSLGNPDLDPPPEFHRTIGEMVSENRPGMHAYMPNGGYPDVRAAIAEYVKAEYGVAVSGTEVVMSCGAGGALNVILKSIVDPGDTVLACTPCFMEYRAYAANHGAELVLVDGAADFDLDIAALEAAIDARTAAVIINSPNNPSGRVYPERTIAELGAMLERKSKEIGRAIYLVSDEPYRQIVFDGLTVPSVFDHYRNTIVASSYSKELSIPGERIGWIAVHPEADDAKRLVDALILCTRVLGFVNAPALMQRVVGRLVGHRVDITPYVRRRELLCSGLEALGFELVRPDGTFYLFPKAPGGDDLAFVEALQEELVLTVPGRGFGKPGYFRIAFCVDDEVISGSLNGFERVIKRFA
jgi:aspartate aminotransferase